MTRRSSDRGPRRSDRPALTARLSVRLVVGFVAVLATSSLVSSALEAGFIRDVLRSQPAALISDRGDVLDNALRRDATRVRQLVTTVTQQVLLVSELSSDDADSGRALLDVLSTVRTADAELRFGSVVDVDTGQVAASLVTRHVPADPGPLDLTIDGLGVRGSQRVAELTDGGFALVYTTPVRLLDDDPRLLVVGYPLDDARAQSYARLTGVDAVEVVVDGRVVASTPGIGAEGVPAGDVDRIGVTQVLDDGSVLRYVAIGSDRTWDHAAVVGLLQSSPFVGVEALLLRARIGTFVVLLVIGGGLAVLLARIMAGPILRLADTATSIAAGDLDRRFDVDRGDELGSLAVSLERMRLALRAQVQVILRQAQALKEAARRTLRVTDQERRRVAQDLHDGIQQQLVLLRMQVGSMQAQVEQDPDRVGELTGALAGSIDALLDDLRSTGQSLYPSILHDRGLSAALFSLASRSELPVEVHVTPEPLPRFDEEIEAHAYFLVSEAVVNALKHAGSDRIHVEVAHEHDRLRLLVRDEGRGFDAHDTAHVGGLVHLRDRVNALGGTIQLVSTPGEGTEVTASIPLSAAGHQRHDGASTSSGGALQVEQHGGDPPVEVDLLGEAELSEDGVRVFLDRPIGDG